MKIKLDRREPTVADKITVIMPNGEEIRITMDAENDLIVNGTNYDHKMIIIPSAGNQFVISHKGGE